MDNSAIINAVLIVWMVSSHAGTYFTWWCRRDAKRELEAVIREKINSVAVVETRGDLRQENGRLFGQVILDLIGWNAILSGRSVDNDIDWVALVLFMSFNLILTYNSYIAFHTRRQSMAILRRQKEIDDGA